MRVGNLGEGLLHQVDLGENGGEINEISGRYKKHSGDIMWLSLGTAGGRDFDYGDPDSKGEYEQSPKRRKRKFKLSFISSCKVQNGIQLKFHWRQENVNK